jgi:uncharacterized membrane protein
MVKKEKNIAKKGIENEKLCALLSYLLIGIIWYFIDEKMKKSNFAKFHVKQGLVLIIAAIIYDIIIRIIFGPLMMLSLGLIWPIIQLLMIVPWIFVIIGIINALNGKEKELPLIGKFSEKFTF